MKVDAAENGILISGRPLQVVFVLDEDETIYVIHARPLSKREKRRLRRREKR